ncbi:MAG: sugar phosphate isomerase/epimerase, partial [Thermoplasmata archaeon]|nr:sugar phosphate isomerase/epimerase [Thermoplasmata archaeon]
ETGRVRDWWTDRGITIIGMQALLFGTTGLNMFGDPEIQASMLAHLDVICRIGAGLGATKLVFGSPKNRDCSSLSDEQAQSVAAIFFRHLGDIASRHGVMICLEPNPPCYGANFMTNSTETAKIVLDVSHPAIRMQMDTGAITINGEDPCQVINEYGALIGHVHASEPDLVVLGDGKTDHGKVASMLRTCLPDQVVSIEMLPAKNEPNLPAIERALAVAIRHYRYNEAGASV